MNTLVKVNEPKATGKFRWIIELSCMSNNEELVVHADFEIDRKQFADSELKKKLTAPFQSPKLVICRPVFEQEIQEGLNVSYIGSLYDQERPKFTTFLDGIYKLAIDLKFMVEHWKSPDPTEMLSHIIAYNFYDCMSGGMPIGMVIGCRHLLKELNCDLNHEVYPGKDRQLEKWYTLQDFLDETSNSEEFTLAPGFVKGLLNG